MMFIRLFVCAAIVFAAVSVRAQQQSQQVFTLQVSESDLVVIGRALEAMPYRDAAPVIARLQAQLKDAAKQKQAPSDDGSEK